MSVRRVRLGGVVRLLAIFAAMMLVAAWAGAFEKYRTSKQVMDNCAQCHGDYNTNVDYQELAVDGQLWTSGLMNVHKDDMLNNDCDVCHKGTKFPVFLGDSDSGFGLSQIGCSGCHGRDEDSTTPGTPANSVGSGAGLRQHHWNANVDVTTVNDEIVNTRICGTCHLRADAGDLTDADPANFTTVGEDVLPVYYAQDGGTVRDLMPSDPCLGDRINDPPSPNSEDIDGAVRGNDNDGDGCYDMDDTDCDPSSTCGAVSTPGEASGDVLPQMLVTAHNTAAGTLDLSYGATCVATDNSLVWGDLDFGGAATYNYLGEICSIGNTGTFSGWSLPAGSVFFLIVANDGASLEGSYGQDTALAERGPNAACGFSQDLANRCD